MSYPCQIGCEECEVNRNALESKHHTLYSMRLSFALVLLLTIFVAGICIAGCTSTSPAPVSSVKPDAPPPLTTASISDTNVSPSFLFVQESLSGMFVGNPDGTYILTLNEVVPYTIYFTDRPYRIAGFTPMNDFIAEFNWTVVPNAAISRSGAKESEDTLIVELSNPRYNESAKQIVYNAKVISNYSGDKLSEFKAKEDPGLPVNLGRVSIFIDSSSGTPITCPSAHPFKCGDESCRLNPTDCPPRSICPSSRPFLCSDGSCAMSSVQCPVHPHI